MAHSVGFEPTSDFRLQFRRLVPNSIRPRVHEIQMLKSKVVISPIRKTRIYLDRNGTPGGNRTPYSLRSKRSMIPLSPRVH